MKLQINRPFLNVRREVIILNRALAWSLIIAPGLQFALNVSWGISFQINATIFILHGLLSFVLFGTPRISALQAQHWLRKLLGGFRPKLIGRASIRQLFLFDAWRVWLSATSLVFMMFATDRGWGIFLFLYILFVAALFPVSLFRHIRDASHYATLRWDLPIVKWSNLGEVAFLLYFFSNLLLLARH